MAFNKNINLPCPRCGSHFNRRHVDQCGIGSGHLSPESSINHIQQYNLLDSYNSLDAAINNLNWQSCHNTFYIIQLVIFHQIIPSRIEEQSSIRDSLSNQDD